METYLKVKWSISRGYETAGYNICTLTDESTGKRYRSLGGGYDLLGTVFGEWLQETHQDALARIAGRAHQTVTHTTGSDLWDRTTNQLPDALYGMTLQHTRKMTSARVLLDGGCGFESMRRIAEAIGLTVTGVDRDRRGNPRGYVVTVPLKYVNVAAPDHEPMLRVMTEQDVRDGRVEY